MRIVQRALAGLEDKGLVKKLKGEAGEKFLDPMPLVERLQAYTKVDKDYLARTGGSVA